MQNLTSRVVRTVGTATRSEFIRNVAMTLACQGASLVFTIVNAALIARLLGPEGKGIVSLTLMVPGVLALVLNGGVGIANVYLVGSGRLSLSEASRASISFTLVACVSGALVAAMFMTTGWLRLVAPGVPTHLQALAMGLMPLNILDGYLSALLLGMQRITVLNVLSAVVAAANALGIVLFVGLWRWDIPGAVAASMAGALLSVLLKGSVLAGDSASFRPSRDLATMARMMSFGMKGQVGNILQFFNYRLDTFILNYFRGPAAVGVYGAAVSVAELLWQLPNAVGFVIFPKAAATRAGALNTFTPRVFKATLVLTAVGALVLTLGGRMIIEWVYSSTFAAANGPLLGLLPGVVLLGGTKVLANEMAGRGNPHYNSIISGTGLVVTVILDLLLIPRMGVLGAAVASSIAYGTSFLLCLILYGVVVRRDSLTESEHAEVVSTSP